MKKIALYILICSITITIPLITAADDVDMYNTSSLKPNVLIIFDDSLSMTYGVPYNDSDTYAGSYNNGPTDYYRRQCLRWGWFGCRRWGSWQVYTGAFTDNDNPKDGIHDSDDNIRRGNRLNFDYGDQDNRLGVAKQAIKDIIDQTKDYVRFGIMVLTAGDPPSTGSDEYHYDQTVLDNNYGGAIIADRTNAEIEDLKTYIDNMSADGYTPLANRLINAGEYFKGNFGYASPIDATNWCRQNYVILMTDGEPTAEGNDCDNAIFDNDNDPGDFNHIETWFSNNGVAANYDGNGNDPNGPAYGLGGSDYLDDVAKYLHDVEDSVDPTPSGVPVEGNQNLTIYTIGFHKALQLLEDTATNGGGEYYTAFSSQELATRLQTVMASIIEKTQTFTAPVVPVQRTTSGNKMYISLFTPKSHNNFWPGYLMKLHIGSDGQLYANDETTPATDVNDNLLEELWNPSVSPNPYWEAHAVLKGMNLANRNIYTYLGTTVDLDDSTNAFAATNSTIDNTMLDNPAKSVNADPTPTAREDLIRYLRGYDSYDDDANGVYNETRENIFGDILHSRPLLIDYVIDDQNPSNNVRVIYVGTNDGMLHAIDDSDGSEKWAFIPPDLLPKLKEIVEASGHQYFVDSSPKAYIKDVDNDGNIEDVDGDQVIIIFGERRGGTGYTALDVTDPDDPQFLWRIDNIDNSATFGIPAPELELTGMGQTWSEPAIGKVKYDGANKVVAIIGGGYWPDEQSKGNALYLIDVTDGTLVEDFTVSDHANMTYSMPSSPLAVDTTGDCYINRVYIGDLGGQMWRFGYQRADGSDTNPEDGDVYDWNPRRLFQGNSGTKIFYTPDLVLEPGYAYLYYGTGDRTDPMDIPSPDPDINRFYAVKDSNEPDDPPFTTQTEADLVDLTSDLLQDGDPSNDAAILASLESGDGWYIILDNDGEKNLAPPVVIYGVVLFTTFTPISDPCSYGGDARLYALDYLTAESVWDFDEDSDLDQSDRSLVIGYGIPTEVVITIGADGVTRLYVAVGGKIFMRNFSSGSSGLTINSWRELF